jgi:hypothetical protein
MSSAALERRSVRRARVAARAPRWGFLVAVAVLSLAGLVSIVRGAPPSAGPAIAKPASVDDDVAVLGFAEAFARAYLAYDVADPEARVESLAPFVSGELDEQAAVGLPLEGRRRVTWTATLGQRPVGPGRVAVTVAVAVSGDPLLRLLAVTVARAPDGRLAVAQPPALIGAAGAPFVEAPDGVEVADGALRAVVERALGNYLAGARENLRADLVAGARMPVPRPALRLIELTDLIWVGRDAIAATLLAEDRDGGVYTLRYELAVRRRDRWYLAGLRAGSAFVKEDSR